MKRPALPLDLSAEPAHLPTFLRIARAFATSIGTGRLPPGTRISGSRALALALGVHRNTVLAAFRELAAEGLIETAQGNGTFVAKSLPLLTRSADRERARRQMPEVPAFQFSGRDAPVVSPQQRGAIALYGGLPDVDIVPRAAFARAYRRAIVGARSDVLLYGDARGEPRLRAALSDYLRRERGLAVGADDILITRGSQMALYLLGRVLLAPGDVLAAEGIGYPPAHRALGCQGARLLPIPVDGEGLSVDALARASAHGPVRAVYVTPHHQYPSTVTMSAARRTALLELARARGIAIIEDDYDHEFHYEGRPVLPLGSRDLGSVLYVGTFSKVFAPALRLGFLVAPPPVLAAAAALRFDIDRQGDRLAERALAELLEDGELSRHLLRARALYAARRSHAVAQLRTHLSHVLAFEPPRGGMALWAEVLAPYRADAFVAAARAHGVLIQPGDAFSLTGPIPNVRVGYGGVSELVFARAVKSLVRAAEALCRNRSAPRTKSLRRL